MPEATKNPAREILEQSKELKKSAEEILGYLHCEGLEQEIEKILMEKQPFEVPVNMPCRVWMESPSVWIADCQVLGLTTFNNSADGAKNALINRIRKDLNLRSRGMN